MDQETKVTQIDDEQDENSNQIQMDLHELSTLFSVQPVDNNENSLKINLTSLTVNGLENEFVTVILPDDYPISQPKVQINIYVIQKFKRSYDKLFQLSNDKKDVYELDVSSLLKSEWKSSHSIIDLVLNLNLTLQKLLTDLNSPFCVDYAYPSHFKEHLGVYQLHTDKPLKKLRAAFDFEAADENELALNTGDIVEVLFERQDGWTLGLLNGISGLVPANHLEPLQQQQIN